MNRIILALERAEKEQRKTQKYLFLPRPTHCEFILSDLLECVFTWKKKVLLSIARRCWNDSIPGNTTAVQTFCLDELTGMQMQHYPCS
jgi:hypothetical protein